jgi:2'-5' RNA ligase
MRLFIAVNFDEKTLNNIYKQVNYLKEQSLKGRFVHKEHIHLTIEFLGDVLDEEVKEIQKMIFNTHFDPFEIVISGIGVFHNKHGDIYWLGIKENEDLSKLYNDIHYRLKQMDLKVQERDYTPHITLGRNVVLSDKLEKINFTDFSYKVEKISLFKSFNAGNKLIHEIISESK